MKILLLSLISFSLAQTTSTQCVSEQEGRYHQQMEKLITELSQFKIESSDFEKKRENLLLQLQSQQEVCGLAAVDETKSSRAPASLDSSAVEYEEIEPSDVAE
ncbi:hypothetical protein K2X05_03265 [bacterium]|nr:hypothetical protein [bacterium]